MKKAKYLQVSAGVRYWDDGSVDGVEDTEGTLIPFGGGDYWDIKIDIETGFIVDWPTGVSASVHYKVCDDGHYNLQSEDGETLETHEGYAISCMSPEKNGYGDYIIMSIDNLGHIRGWDSDAVFEDFSYDR